MILLNAPIQQDKIIDTLTHYSENGVSYKFIKKNGMKLYFESTLENEEEAAQLAKKIIKGTDYGAILYFQATVE